VGVVVECGRGVDEAEEGGIDVSGDGGRWLCGRLGGRGEGAEKKGSDETHGCSVEGEDTSGLGGYIAKYVSGRAKEQFGLSALPIRSDGFVAWAEHILKLLLGDNAAQSLLDFFMNIQPVK
jgi:hypothetical protein